MSRVDPSQGNFSGGEVSPFFFGRTDSPQYKLSLATCLNYLPTVQGALTRRPGSYYVAGVKTNSAKTRLIPFIAATKQAYILEFGNLYIRFYKNDGQIQSSGPYEIVSPWTTAELPLLKYAQVADTMYLVQSDKPPQVLQFFTDTIWILSAFAVTTEGPYEDVNGGAPNAATLSNPSGDGGVGSAGVTIHVTASSQNGVNGGNGFTPDDVGRLLRLYDGSTKLWSLWRISVVSGLTTFQATWIYGLSPNSSGNLLCTTWRLGLWYTGNYPSAVCLHEDRLVFGGVPTYPQRIDGSAPDDFTNFQNTDVSGNVTAGMAYSFTLASSTVNIIEWLTSGYRGLYAGTNGGEWLVNAGNGEAITPINPGVAKQVTLYGDAPIQPVQVADVVLFVQRSSLKIREMAYVYYVDGYQAVDLNLVAEHVTRSGIVAMDFQNEPQPVLWCVRSDGTLIAMTYERNLDALKVGWSRHVLGGSSAGGGQALVESVAVIPYFDGTRDEVWLIVNRFVNGQTVRTIEVLTQFFDEAVEQEDAFFVDCGQTYDSPIAITGAANSSPVVVTAPAHGFSNGNKVLFDGILGMTDLNGGSYLVAAVTTNTFQLTDLFGNPIDSTNFGAYVTGGVVRKMVTTISGLDYLDGQSVAILADGAVQPNRIVSSGSITLETPAAVVQVGLPYTSDCQLLRLEAGSQDGTSFGKKQRYHRVGVQLYRSLGLKIGMDFEEMETVTFRKSNDPAGRAPALFTGVVWETMRGDYDYENKVCIRQDQPLPSIINSVLPRLVTQDSE